ncbi:MAG: TrmH family RNA methyltransferase [Rhizobiales bacterium]|nr:TrmH family RNA methyltransferase [Hyphomicrobiales bacterium]
MRGYFAIGIEGVSKPMNVGSLVRSAHAFGAAFVFTVAAHPRTREAPSDTSHACENLPVYRWRSIDEMALPTGCTLVAVEFTEGAIELPSYRHPRRAAYVLGPERGAVSQAMRSRCAHVIKIPTSFCINVATAGAIVMYDRLRCHGGFPERPVMPGGPVEPANQHVHGRPRLRRAEEGEP